MSMLIQEAISFATVLLVAVCIAGAVSVLYAFGLRFWSRASVDALTIGHLHAAEGGAHDRVHVITRLAAALCFAACAAIVLFALWLMIPAFH